MLLEPVRPPAQTGSTEEILESQEKYVTVGWHNLLHTDPAHSLSMCNVLIVE